MAQTVKRLPTMWEIWVRSLGWGDPLEKEMATHSSTLAWKIPWTEEPGRLQSMSDFTFFFFLLSWRQQQSWKESALSPGLVVGNCLWGRTESDKTEAT